MCEKIYKCKGCEWAGCECECDHNMKLNFGSAEWHGFKCPKCGCTDIADVE